MIKKKKNRSFFGYWLSVLVLTGISLCSSAQEGIQWAKLSGWDEVLAAAKKENKYIFVDCYATWCVPCKKMDANTFSSKQVGEYFNDKFISIKIQMDSTKRQFL